MTEELLECAIDFALGGSIGVMSWFLGGRDGIIMVLLASSVIDQISGLAAGWAEHKISSDAGFKGILRKCFMFGLVGMANLIDRYIMPGNSDALRTIVCTFYIANEGISILENAERLGLPIPSFMRDRFLNMKKLTAKKEKNHDLR